MMNDDALMSLPQEQRERFKKEMQKIEANRLDKLLKNVPKISSIKEEDAQAKKIVLEIEQLAKSDQIMKAEILMQILFKHYPKYDPNYEYEKINFDGEGW